MLRSRLSAPGEQVMRNSRMSVNLRFFDPAVMLVRLDHVTRYIVNANHGIV